MNWDDDVYVCANPAFHPLNAEGVARLASAFYYYAYIPATMLSHAADVAVWGMNPRGHHLTNVLLHTANAVWVFFLGLALLEARRGSRKGGDGRREAAVTLGMGIAAVLFAVHPLRAESVSWISDRKDLLCAFFLLPALLAYLRYASAGERGRARSWYVLSFVLFLLACLSKLIAAMFPVVLLLLDRLWLERRREGKGRAVVLLEKVPFLLVSLALIVLSSTVSPEAKRAYSVSHLTGPETWLFPFYSLLFSLYKTVAPFHLSPIYPRIGLEWMAAGFAVFLALTACLALVARRGVRGPLLAWAIYLVLLAPNVAGLSSGMQPVADRYSYLATIGLFLLFGGAIAMLWGRGRAWQRPAVLAGATILAILLATSARSQAARWKSSISLWESVIQSAPAKRDYVDAYLNLGVAYSDARRPAEAVRTLERAAAVDSSNADVLWNLAMLTYAGGDRKLAADRFRAVLRVSPRRSDAWYNYALVLDELGRHEEAVPAMIRAARLGSKDAREALAGVGLTW